jgi:hypothetical protein
LFHSCSNGNACRGEALLEPLIAEKPGRTNPMTIEKTPPVPHHVEEAVATIAALHAAHHREARALQKAVSRATRGIAQPATLILTTVAIATWAT